MIWTLPNALTLIRLLAAPGLALLFLFVARPWANWAAVVLFVGASLTDYADGWLARRLNRETRMGAMLDPIADKAMVVIALMALAALYGLSPWILLPATAIVFREVFVSGLREYLGNAAGTLKVTRLAKWKTFVQMVAIAVLLSQGLFEHYFGMWSLGMDPGIVGAVLSGEEEDVLGLRFVYAGMVGAFWGGVGLLWIAAALTLATGADYYVKALPLLRGRP